MEYAPCFNTCSNINYRQRSQTLQPIHRGDPLDAQAKQLLLEKYFQSQIESAESERANYANVPATEPDTGPLLSMHQTLSRNHQFNHHSRPFHQNTLHARSHSQHHYHLASCQPNDPNNYYNLSNERTTVIPARSRHPSPINEPPHDGGATAHHNHPAHIGSLAVMQVCAELNCVDSAPPLPKPRNYTISPAKDCALYRVKFPHRRYIKSSWRDRASGLKISAGESVLVCGPSEENRTNFLVRYNDMYLELPHYCTLPPQPSTLTQPTHWN